MSKNKVRSSKRKPRSATPRLYRVFPWLEKVATEQPGHALFVPAVQGAGRIDNPDRYGVLYAADSPAGAVAESFGNHSAWTPELFRIPALPGARRALATLGSEHVAVVDLDDARTLLDRALRPSDVVTLDRPRTQAWSLAVFKENKWDGIRWWSRHDPDRGSFGLWNLANLSVVEVVALDLDHPAVIDAAQSLRRLIER